MRRSPLLITAGVLVLTVTTVVAVKFVRTYETPASAGRAPVTVEPSAPGDPLTYPSGGPGGGGGAGGDIAAGDPAAQQRFAAAAELTNKAAGHLGVIVRDRRSGAEWRAGEADRATWASSTIKLAMAANLLERGRTGEVKLDTAARKSIADMLETSSDKAADALWDKYGGEGFVPWFQQQYGMHDLQFPAGAPRRWGQLKCTPADLLRFMTYLLDRADPADRDYLTAAMRRPGKAQQWGVWAAGADKQPGVANGWSIQVDDKVKHWVTHSVGFAGQDAQYAIVIMFDQPAGAKVDTGVHTVSDVIATLFGTKVPADVSVPPAA
jgi:hypothetical protein